MLQWGGQEKNTNKHIFSTKVLFVYSEKNLTKTRSYQTILLAI